MVGRLLELLQPTIERVKRADPFLMAAAIAYNVLFAVVPLALAMVAALTLVGRSPERVETIARQLADAFSPETAESIVRFIEDAREELAGATGLVIGISLLIALYSGSRAIYAAIKALRLVQGEEDHRGYVRVRSLGIAFTLGAGIALLLANLLVFFGTEIVQYLEEVLGITTLSAVRDFVVLPVLGLWTVGLLFGLYRWGPPSPVTRPFISAVAAMALVGVGTVVFQLVAAIFGFGAVGVLGSAAVLLLWVYYMALIVIVVPEAVAATLVVVRNLPSLRASRGT